MSENNMPFSDTARAKVGVDMYHQNSTYSNAGQQTFTAYAIGRGAGPCKVQFVETCSEAGQVQLPSRWPNPPAVALTSYLG